MTWTRCSISSVLSYLSKYHARHPEEWGNAHLQRYKLERGAGTCANGPNIVERWCQPSSRMLGTKGMRGFLSTQVRLWRGVGGEGALLGSGMSTHLRKSNCFRSPDFSRCRLSVTRYTSLRGYKRAVMSDRTRWALPGHEVVMKSDPGDGTQAGPPLQSRASCRGLHQESASHLRHLFGR